MTDSYKVTFDDGVTEWVTPGKKDGPPEVGDVYEQEVTVERTIIHVEQPVLEDEPEVTEDDFVVEEVK